MKRHPFLTLCLFGTLWLCGCNAYALALEPVAVITGPSNAKAGTLVVLSSIGSISDPGGLAWTFIDGKCQAIEGVNHDLGFVQGEPGTVIVGLVAVATTDGKPKIAIAKHPVVIGDGPAPVPPGPTPPGPTPPAPLPDGRYGFAKVAYNAGLQVPADARSRRSKTLAAAFGSLASQIPNLPTVDKIMAAAKSANAAALAEDAPAWEPVRLAINDSLGKAYAAKQVQTVADWQAVWNEYSVGLAAL